MITGYFFLDWALISVSLFDAILLLWLGLTVLMNAERRTWGFWLVEGGLALSALFFISHTVIVGHELTVFGSQDLEGWWRLGWIPVILLPFVWYAVILWYSGFWDSAQTRLHRRHRLWLVLASAQAAGLLALMIFARPIPAYAHLTRLDLSETTALAGIPLLFIMYPPFGVLCILLPLDALNHPAPSQRMMGDLARQRSRPWLGAISAVLLVVSLMVMGFMLAVIYAARTASHTLVGVGMIQAVALLDLTMATLIGAAVILLGQAIVSYEVFTGKALPRRGFFRHWRNTILLAVGAAIPVGYTLVVQPLPIFSLLLATLLMTAFYALFSWRSFVEREQFMARLRPFVSSQRLMQHLVGVERDTASRAHSLFHAICQDVLGTQQARLIPLGVLAPLAGPPLVYPSAGQREPVRLPRDLFSSPDLRIVALDLAAAAGLRWAVPLWGERGLIGTLLLDEKSDGGLYTQEEIEIAQASGERIIDMLAGEQVAQRLMELQRRRLAETRVVDLRTRRALHDDILPTLHAALLRLSGAARDDPAVREAIGTLTGLHHQMSDLIHTSSGPAATGPGRGLAQALQQMVQDEYKDAFNSVMWQVADSLPPLDPLAQEAIFGAAREAVRNAAVHGRGSTPERPLNLCIAIQNSGGLSITVSDDGVGLLGAPRPAPDAAPPAGNGKGLALHSTMMAIVGGYLTVETPPVGGTQVTITLPQEAREPGN
jgi:signal transduction histidine kinase